MNSLFQKISIFILIAVCVILVVDKTRQSLHLNGVATRIAEKTAELERTKTEFTVVREKLQNEIRERDDRFRLLPRRTTEKKGVPQPADPQDSEFLQMSAALSKNAASPGQLLWSFKKIAEEKHLLPDTFRIDPVTGLVVSRAASLLSSAAKSAGMDVNTSLIWDMRDFQPHVIVEILPPELPDKTITGQPVTLNLAHRSRKTPDDSGVLLCQDRMESVIFPFTTAPKKGKEQTILPTGCTIPCGGLYLHSFVSDEPSPWFLEYEFPEDAAPQEMNLLVVPLTLNMKITSHISDKVQSFLIEPGSGKSCAFLVGADKAFLPVRITATLAEQKISVEKKNSSTKPGEKPAPTPDGASSSRP